MGPGGANSDGYDFFGGSTVPVPPAGPAAGAPLVGADQRFGAVPAAPPGQFGAPVGQFGAPVGPVAPRRPAKKGPPGWAIGLGVVVVLGVLVAAAVMVVPHFFGSEVDKAWKATTVAMPPSLAGYTQDKSPGTQRLVDSALAEIKDTDAPDPKAAVYSNGTNTVIAIAAKYAEPKREGASTAQEDFVAALRDGDFGDPGSLVPVPAGKLGGSAFCARTIGDQELLVCGTSDVAAVTMFIIKDTTTPNSTVIAMREAVEQRA